MNAQYKQIGNAVPVNLGYHIGRCLIAMLEDNPDYEIMEEANSSSPISPIQSTLFS